LPGPYWWLWAGVLVNRLGGLVVPYLSIYLTERRGASVAQAGAIASLFGLGSIASGPVAGMLADRLGRRTTMTLALALAGSGMIALGYVERLELIAAGALVLGFLAECYRPAMSAAVADLVPELEDRLRAYALFFWAANLGFSVALAAAGLLARVSFRLLFALDGLTTLAFGGLVALKVPETRPRGGPAPAERALAGLVLALRDRELVKLVGLNFLAALMLWQAHATLPLYLRARGLSTSTYGALMALNGLVIVVLQPFVAPAAQRFDAARVLSLSGVLVGAGWGLNALAATTPAYALAIVVWTLGEILSTPTGSALVAELAPPSLRGRYQGLYAMSWAFAAATAPAAGALVLARLGARALWGGCLGLGLLLALLHLAAAGPRRRRLEASRAARAPAG